MTEKTIEQRTFDRAYIGLAMQGWIQSANATGHCLYRHTTPEGKALACAAGHLIRSHQYHPAMEFTRAREGLVRDVILQNGFDPLFAAMIQKVHDGEGYLNGDENLEYSPFTAMSPAELKAAFDAFAVKHELTIPEVPS